MKPALWAVEFAIIRNCYETQHIDIFILHRPAVCAADFSAYVPKGWKIIKSVKGDLNGDNQADAVLVLQKQDKANIIPNDSMGQTELDTNPRMLKVLFKQVGGYKTAVENTTLIPPEDSKDNGCLGDPFSDLSIDKGRLKLRFEWFTVAEAGGWVIVTTYSVTKTTAFS